MTFGKPAGNSCSCEHEIAWDKKKDRRKIDNFVVHKSVGV